MFVIQFRNGLYLGHQEHRSVPLDDARRFALRADADDECSLWSLAGGAVYALASATPPPRAEPSAQALASFIAACKTARSCNDFHGLFKLYCGMQDNSTGGSLHIVLDDDNHERSHVVFCHQYALENGDAAGAALAAALLSLSDPLFEEVFQPIEAAAEDGERTIHWDPTISVDQEDEDISRSATPRP